MNHFIREGTRGDIEILADTIRESFRDVADRFGLTLENSPRHPSNCTGDWIRLALDQGVRYFILEHDGLVAGCAALERSGSGTCYLERLCVLPLYRGKGFGRELVAKVLAEAGSLGALQVDIGIIADHTELREWYGKLGFVEGESRDFPHLPFRVLFMSRGLA
jgi:GNAT superfamily N-acetyltransferase